MEEEEIKEGEEEVVEQEWKLTLRNVRLHI